MLTREQVRAARALLNLSEGRLAELARVSTEVVQQYEDAGTASHISTSNVLRRALEEAGVEFFAENGSVCVHFRKNPAEEGVMPQLSKDAADDGSAVAELAAENDGLTALLRIIRLLASSSDRRGGRTRRSYCKPGRQTGLPKAS